MTSLSQPSLLRSRATPFGLGRRPSRDASGGRRRRWVAAWLGASLLGVANGAAREKVYGGAIDDDAAHVVSTGTLLLLLAGYVLLLERRWPLGNRREALSVGGAWAAMTVAFEFGFGHWVGNDSWSALVANYDITAGRVWILVPAAMAVGPELARVLAERERQ